MIVRHRTMHLIKNRKTALRYTGTKHRQGLLKHLVSKYFQTNPTAAGTLDYIDNVVQHLIDAARDIKKMRNPFIHKNFYDFN